MNRRNLAAPVGAFLVLLASLSGMPVSPPAAAPSPSAVPTSPPALHHIHHVVIVVLENEAIGQVWAHGPYERYLAGQYGNASSVFAPCHPSAPNYLAMVSAETLQCGSDAWKNYSATTLGDLFDKAGFSWRAYAENLPRTACSQPGTSTAGAFAVRHVPFLYFANVTRNQSFCHQHILSSASFNSSVAAGKLANLSFYTPNLCDDGHDGCGGNTSAAARTRQADVWLKDFLGPMLNHTGRFGSSAERTLINGTAFIVLWDEGSGSNAGYPVSGVLSGNTYSYCASHGAKGDAVCGGRVFAVVVSPYSLHRTFKANDSAFGLVWTIEWLFHLGHLKNPGGFDANAGFPAMRALFSFTSN